ncbi:MAG: hypothetical protein RLZZ543_17 [Bacteroidota bacterium]
MQRYQKAVNALLGEWLKCTPEQRVYEPDEGGWSMAQLFSHLIDVEVLATESMRARLASGKIKQQAWKHKRRYFLLVMGLLIPKRYKVPTQVAATAQNAQPHLIAERWKQHQVELNALISELTHNQQQHLVFMHPIAGPLTANQALGFMYFHLLHHLRQLDRIQRSRSYPRS